MKDKRDPNDQRIVVGCLVRWIIHGIFGVVDAIDSGRATVSMETNETLNFSIASGVLKRVLIEIGTQVTTVDQPDIVGVVIGSVPNQPQPTWRVQFPSQSAMIVESGLRPAIIRDPLERLRNGYIGTPKDFDLKSVATDLWTQHLHNDLISFAHAQVDFKPYQVGVVHRVITEYPHRFLLCDEVGLGKTIEAAMIVKELCARKAVNRILILVPSGLLRQWQFELKTKFNETFAIYNRDTIRYLQNQQGIKHPWTQNNKIIASHTWASRADIREQISAVNWDMIIVDEAHHVRSQRSGNSIKLTNLYRLVEALIARPEYARRSVLFLTATPMQLQYHELYSLVEMLDPILFSSEEDFTRHLQSRSDLNNIIDNLRHVGIPTQPDDLNELARMVADFLKLPIEEATSLVSSNDPDLIIRRLSKAHRLSEILIRNRRNSVGNFQPRSAFRWPVKPTELERKIHQSLNAIVAQGFALAELTNSRALGFVMTTFKKLAASSSRALLKSLTGRRNRLLAIERQSSITINIEDAEEALESDTLATDVINSLDISNEQGIADLNKLIGLLSEVKVDSKAVVLRNELHKLFQAKPNAKVIIFTQFRETQEMLKEILEESDWGVHTFHGQLKPLQKDQSIESFRLATGPQVLISTEAGGEGRNFQFCHYLVNYDLPWNPMKVEQRIGRIDRIGQNQPVMVFNLFVEETIEERVLDVLEHRIHLFTEAIGGLEPILGEIESDIRKSIRLAGEIRENHFASLARDTEKKVKARKEAEEQMADLMLDKRSFGTKIFKTARGIDELVTSKDYEQFLIKLLKAANTYIKPTTVRGVYEIMFHPPLTMEIPKIIDEQDQRLVCFIPGQQTDSEMIEYMGFGHPIIDYLTKSCIYNWLDGTATIKRMKGFPYAGWQFNWLVTIGSLRTRSFVHATFISNDGVVDRGLGLRLLKSSRYTTNESASCEIDSDDLSRAYEVALSDVGALLIEESIEAKTNMTEHGEEERSRIEALHKQRSRAANDRLERVRLTLERLALSDRPEDQSVVPMWRAKLERAEAELHQVDRDQDDMLNDLRQRLQSASQYKLLNAARILV